MKKILIALAALVAAAGCTTAYGPRYERASAPSGFGYYDTQLDQNRYRVQYRARESGPYAEDFAMRRAAELTVQRRYDWFQIVARSRRVSDDFFGRYDGTRYYRDDLAYRERPRYGDGYDDAVVVLEIVMGYNPPPRASSIYDARQVLNYRYDSRYGAGYRRY